MAIRPTRASRPSPAAKFRGPPLLEAAATLATRPDGTMVLGVVADTHSHPHPAIYTQLPAVAPDAILHAGDIGDLGVLDALGRIAPVVAVRGNIDGRGPQLPDVVTLDLVHAGARKLRILLLHIGVNGPRLRADVVRRAQAVKADVVVCGHSHVPFVGLDRGFGVFNPGSVGPRRFHLPILFGTLTLTPSGVRFGHVDCETGRPWSPP